MRREENIKVDLISRADAFKALQIKGDYNTLNEVYDRLEKLPSVTPARKKGEWEVAIGYDPNRSFMCDCCMKMAYEPTLYCPYCGAEMEVDG